MPFHLMLDTETWDTEPTAVVRAVALALFDPLSGDIAARLLLDLRLTVDEQIEAGRTISENTVAWWRGRDLSLSQLIGPPDPQTAPQRLEQALQQFGAFIRPSLATGDNGDAKIAGRIWTRGHFDLPVLASLIRIESPNHPLPWDYWQARDVRTLDEITPKQAPAQPHHPMSDCEAQIAQVRAAYQGKAA